MKNFKIFQDFFFKIIIQAYGGNLLKTNRHLFLLNGHNSHVTLEVVHKARNVVLDFIILPFHMSHVLHPLDVVCFKPFKISFRVYRDVCTLANKVKRVRKEDLV
jgi:hypothetical protein